MDCIDQRTAYSSSFASDFHASGVTDDTHTKSPFNSNAKTSGPDSESLLRRMLFSSKGSSSSMTSKDVARKRWTTAITAIVKHSGNPIGSYSQMHSPVDSTTNINELRHRILQTEQEQELQAMKNENQQ